MLNPTGHHSSLTGLMGAVPSVTSLAGDVKGVCRRGSVPS